MAKKRRVHVIEKKSRRGKKWYPLIIEMNKEGAQTELLDQRLASPTGEFRLVMYVPDEPENPTE